MSVAVTAATADSGDPLGRWNHGADCAKEPPIEMRELESELYVLRQSLCTSVEGMFMYLLIGNERALLVDTGTATVNPQEIVDRILTQTKDNRSGAIRELIVAHTAAFHSGGDRYFRDRPETTIVPVPLKRLQDYYRLRDWPNDIANLDLGGRSIQVIPTPGHTAEHIAFYDGTTQTLLSGDLVMPGKLSFIFVN